MAEIYNTYDEHEKNIGQVCVADDVVAVIAGLAATEVEGVKAMAGNITNDLVSKLGMKMLSKGVKVLVNQETVKVKLAIIIKYNYGIPEVSAKVQEHVKTQIENMTGLNVISIDVQIAGVEVA